MNFERVGFVSQLATQFLEGLKIQIGQQAAAQFQIANNVEPFGWWA